MNPMTNPQPPYSFFDPEYDLSGYNRRDALSFAVASEAAYADEDIAKEQFLNWGFDKVEFFEVIRGKDIDTQGIVARSDDHIIAAFRGSESKMSDWYTNLQAVTDPGPLSGCVHEGFQDAFQAATYQIGNVIAQLRDNNQKVWITGHSLGGALSVLLAATLLEPKGMAYIPLAGVYTFGSPRVGNKKFASVFNRRMPVVNYRVVNLRDVVPHLPPEHLFSHVGKRVLLEKYHRSSLSRKWVEAKGNIWRLIGREMGKTKSIIMAEPHSLLSDMGYIQYLKNDLDRSKND